MSVYLAIERALDEPRTGTIRNPLTAEERAQRRADRIRHGIAPP